MSFPKAGRTWLRVLLGVVEAERRGEEVDRVVREWLWHDAPRLAGERILLTHALASTYMEPPGVADHFLAYIADRRRLFLFRDPRDTVVSYYFQLVRREHRDRAVVLEGLSDFVRDPVVGIDHVLTFMRACYESSRTHPGPASVLTYEDLHADPRESLRSALRFFGAPVPADEVLDRAVRYGSFEHMHALEKRAAFPDTAERLLPAAPDDPESFKTRRGVVGGFHDYLSSDTLAFVDERIDALLPSELGYRCPGAPGTALRVRHATS